MAQPGRPRRRNKTSQQPQTIQEPQLPRHPIKEEPTNTLHDESDLVSFRTEALLKFTSNQEYLEALLKYVHLNKIIPPASFPNASTKQLATELTNEDLYIGNLELMKQVEKQLESEIQDLSKPYEYTISPEYEEQKLVTAKLVRLFQNMNNETTFEELKTESNQVLKDYNKKFNKRFEHVQTMKTFSNPKIADIEVTEAPKDYNPRLINDLINFNNMRGMSHNNGPGDPNAMNQINDQKMGEEEGMDIGSFLSTQRNPSTEPAGPYQGLQPTAGIQAHMNGLPDGGPSLNMDSHKPDIYHNQDDGAGHALSAAIGEDNLANDNLGADDGLGNGSLNNSHIGDDNLVDDMGDLINFQGDDEEIINGNFDEDFLSQIDHSME